MMHEGCQERSPHNDIIPHVNNPYSPLAPDPRRLVVVKALYFLYFAAVGGFFYYLYIYYNQIGLTSAQIGILNYSILSKARKYMIVINLVLGAVLTTPEVITQLIMFLPLQTLFEITIWIAWYWERQEKKREAAVNASEGLPGT